jgi:hypothetical protein
MPGGRGARSTPLGALSVAQGKLREIIVMPVIVETLVSFCPAGII